MLGSRQHTRPDRDWFPGSAHSLLIYYPVKIVKKARPQFSSVFSSEFELENPSCYATIQSDNDEWTEWCNFTNHQISVHLAASTKTRPDQDESSQAGWKRQSLKQQTTGPHTWSSSRKINLLFACCLLPTLFAICIKLFCGIFSGIQFEIQN